MSAWNSQGQELALPPSLRILSPSPFLAPGRYRARLGGFLGPEEGGSPPLNACLPVPPPASTAPRTPAGRDGMHAERPAGNGLWSFLRRHCGSRARAPCPACKTHPHGKPEQRKAQQVTPARAQMALLQRLKWKRILKGMQGCRGRRGGGLGTAISHQPPAAPEPSHTSPPVLCSLYSGEFSQAMRATGIDRNAKWCGQLEEAGRFF